MSIERPTPNGSGNPNPTTATRWPKWRARLAPALALVRAPALALVRALALTHATAVVCVLGGCLELKEHASTQDNTCTACHGDSQRAGDESLRAAPPMDISGRTDPSSEGVGAHTAHFASKTHAQIPCAECHLVPQTVLSQGHLDHVRPEDKVVFGTTASLDGVPAYSAKTGSCTGTYCHKAGAVVWTAPRDSNAACGTCHGLPPPRPHPQNARCSVCHGDVVSDDRTFKRPDLHVNGSVEVAIANTCHACHGTGDDGAPPPDLSGSSDPGARGAGAHAVHLAASATHGAVSCAECHRVPKALDTPGHIDGDGRAEVLFGALAALGDHTPTYDQDTGACSRTYCHGNASPGWPSPLDSASACGTCHGLPPPLPHPQDPQCSTCHGDVVGADGKFKRPNLHVNGQVEVLGRDTCHACHGQGDLGAPPPDLSGRSDPSYRGVGAHAVHLDRSPTHAAVACSECHRVPKKVDEPGHIDGSDHAEVAFGPLATSTSKAPSYDPATGSCRQTYCHANAAPTWQGPRDSKTVCGTCHGLPPPAPHPQLAACNLCHATVAGPAQEIINPDLHINGAVDLGFVAGCTACHGQGAQPAPPPDLHANTDPAGRGVGSHQAHLDPGAATHAAVACSECHRVPTTVDEPGHLDGDGRADVVFGVLASRGDATPVYDRSQATCAGTYCHGKTSASWQNPRSSADACGACHGLPPPPPHPSSERCVTCHSGVVNADRSFVSPDKHVNGVVDVGPVPCDGCHGTGPSGGPPPDLSGSMDPASAGVGAHAIHLNAGPSHGPLACSECHPVPASWDSPGHIDTSRPADLVFGSVARGGAHGTYLPAYDSATRSCSGTYCHRGAITTWTSPRPAGESCGSCHALPPPLPHPPQSRCERCHGAVVDSNGAFVQPSRHVDGKVDVELGCSSCHGSPASSAPPTDLSGSSDRARVGVGAHQIHLSGGSFSRSVECADCHRVPSSIDAPGHIDDWTQAEVRFSALASTRGRSPSWDRTAGTCANTWCHDPDAIGGTSPVWTGQPVTPTCTSCHGMPPPEPHVQISQCYLCHANVDAENHFIDRSLHGNGQADL